MEYTPPNLEDPNEILDYLSPAIRAVHDALDDGVSLADLFFHENDHDPHLWAHIVRYRAANTLHAAAALDWQTGRPLPHSGIQVVRMPLTLRVFKAQGSSPPHAGHSQARQAYWSQSPMLPLVYGDVVTPEQANLILDWNVDERRKLGLALSKPAGLWKYQQTPKLEWRLHIVEPSGGGGLRFGGGDDDLDVGSVLDPDELAEFGDVG